MTGFINHTRSRMRIVHFNGQRWEVWSWRGNNPKPSTCTVEFIVKFEGTTRTSIKAC